MKLIGLTGEAGSGKDEVFKMITYILSGYSFSKRAYRNFIYEGPIENKKFAKKLKQILAIVLECKVEDFEDQNFKKRNLKGFWKKSKNVSTVRDLMQVVGTECFRDLIHNEIWVDLLFSSYTKAKSWIITDVRFETEANAILSKKDSIIIRVQRELNSEDTHSSEKEMNKIPYSYVIDNTGDLQHLFKEVEKVLTHLKLI